jgi:hypothetical protein
LLVLATSGINSAFRYARTDTSAEIQYLALYLVKSVDWLNSEEFSAITVKSDLFPGPSHLGSDFASFDVRSYRYVDTFEKKGAKAGE